MGEGHVVGVPGFVFADGCSRKIGEPLAAVVVVVDAVLHGAEDSVGVAVGEAMGIPEVSAVGFEEAEEGDCLVEIGADLQAVFEDDEAWGVGCSGGIGDSGVVVVTFEDIHAEPDDGLALVAG